MNTKHITKLANPGSAKNAQPRLATRCSARGSSGVRREGKGEICQR
ncbi:MAG: hypothetical protein K6L75_14015 [Cellvibrionaceae bacterium]